MRVDFTGQVALVTGATSGLGKQIADQLAELGARLILTGTDQEEIDLLNKESGLSREYFCVDFSNRISTERFLDALRNYKRVDVCINNAELSRSAALEEVSPKDWDDLIEVNVRAPFLIIQTVSVLMKEKGYGRIVNITSDLSHVVMEKQSLYSTTKFALRGATVSSAIELAKHNVLVNAVASGPTAGQLSLLGLEKDTVAQHASKLPIGRLAEEQDISNVVLFLASEFNSYICGQTIIVDGGYTSL